MWHGIVAAADQGCTDAQDAYDRALGEVDVLVMPTVARPPPNFGHVQGADSPVADNDYLPSVIHNTAPFDSKCPKTVVLYCIVPMLTTRTRRHWSSCLVSAVRLRPCRGQPVHQAADGHHAGGPHVRRRDGVEDGGGVGEDL